MLTDQDRMLFYWELRDRIDHALYAWKMIGVAVDQMRGGIDRGERAPLWFYVEAFLSSSIAVANILWPSTKNKAAQERADELRALLKTSQTAPDGLRDVRNGFEHFDERMDAWRKATTHSSFIDTNVGPKSAIGDFDDNDIARYFDPATSELGVFGKTVLIKDVVEELVALRQLIPARY